jgi:hypothetical protein
VLGRARERSPPDEQAQEMSDHDEDGTR